MLHDGRNVHYPDLLANPHLKKITLSTTSEKKAKKNDEKKQKTKPVKIGADKKFACPHCSKGFLTQPGLDYHVKNTHGVDTP